MFPGNPTVKSPSLQVWWAGDLEQIVEWVPQGSDIQRSRDHLSPAHLPTYLLLHPHTCM